MARLGIVLYHGIEGGPELKSYATIAEEAGLDSLWVTERYFHEETFSLLGYLAAVTQSIRLGLGVANPYTRNPALLAMASATIDRISGGRFVLGLGRSDRSVIQGRMGIPYEDPRVALTETVALVRQLLSGSRVNARGRVFSLKDASLEVKPVAAKTPIYLGASGPKALRLAGSIADGVLLNAYAPAGYVKYAVGEVREAATKAGRDADSVDIACMLVVRPTDEPAAARGRLKQRVASLLAEPHVGEIMLDKGGFDPSILGPLRASVADDGGKSALRLITDEMIDAFYVLGPTTRCVERIVEYREAGVDLPLLLPRLRDFRQVAELSQRLNG